MNNINGQFTISLLIIILGYIFKRLNIVKEEDGGAIARIVLNITLPCLIVNTFSALKFDVSLIKLTLIAIIYGLFMFFIALKLFKKKARKDKGLLIMISPGFNIGLFAYPFIQAIWGHEGVKYFGMFDVGNSIVIFVLCYVVGTYFSGEEIKVKVILKKLSTSIPLITYVTVFLINLLGFHFPKLIIDFTSTVSKANAPLSLLLLGIYLSFSFDLRYFKNIISILSLRYLIGLIVGIILFVFAPFDSMSKNTILIGLILPIAGAAIPFSIEFDYDKKLVGIISNLSIVISFALIWIIVLITN